MFLPVFVCLSVCVQDNSKSYGRIFLKFWGNVGHGINYQWFNFGCDPAGILDSGSLWNFRYHCIKGGIREPLAKWTWWRHLANNIALVEVPAGYDCFLVGQVATIQKASYAIIPSYRIKPTDFLAINCFCCSTVTNRADSHGPNMFSSMTAQLLSLCLCTYRWSYHKVKYNGCTTAASL